MNKLDRLIEQARLRIKNDIPYDFSKLSVSELKELAFEEPTEQRINEILRKSGYYD